MVVATRRLDAGTEAPASCRLAGSKDARFMDIRVAISQSPCRASHANHETSHPIIGNPHYSHLTKSVRSPAFGGQTSLARGAPARGAFARGAGKEQPMSPMRCASQSMPAG